MKISASMIELSIGSNYPSASQPGKQLESTPENFPAGRQCRDSYFDNSVFCCQLDGARNLGFLWSEIHRASRPEKNIECGGYDHSSAAERISARRSDP